MENHEQKPADKLHKGYNPTVKNAERTADETDKPDSEDGTPDDDGKLNDRRKQNQLDDTIGIP